MLILVVPHNRLTDSLFVLCKDTLFRMDKSLCPPGLQLQAVFFLKHHFQSFIEFPIVGKSPFHAVSWHSKMCFVPLRTGSFWGFKQPINTKVPAILYLCGNPGVFCACAV